MVSCSGCKIFQLLQVCKSTTFRIIPHFPNCLFFLCQKRAAPGEAKAPAGAKKAKPTAAGAGAEGGIEIDGVGCLTEAEIAGWAQTGQVR